jgi:hypothetical protein
MDLGSVSNHGIVMDSPTLGYVDATHQTLRPHLDRTVWTFYWALAGGAPAQKTFLQYETADFSNKISTYFASVNLAGSAWN